MPVASSYRATDWSPERPWSSASHFGIGTPPVRMRLFSALALTRLSRETTSTYSWCGFAEFTARVGMFSWPPTVWARSFFTVPALMAVVTGWLPASPLYSRKVRLISLLLAATASVPVSFWAAKESLASLPLRGEVFSVVVSCALVREELTGARVSMVFACWSGVQ